MNYQENNTEEVIVDQNNSISDSKYAWIILGVVFLAGVAAPLNQFKVPPLIPILLDAFHINLSQAGMLMSVFSITGLILALPAGLILQRLGPKTTGLVAIACMIVGSSWGALVQTADTLLASRVVEGIGMGLIAVVAPAAIVIWFPRDRRGLAMGIWSIWGPVGSIAMLTLAPLIAMTFNWQAVWWTGAAFALLAFILYAVFMRTPSALAGEPEVQSDSGGGLRRALANRNLWLLALLFTCFNMIFIGFATFFPTYLAEVQSYSLAEAGFITSLPTIVTLVLAPLVGWISDRIGSRRLLLTFPFLGLAIIFLFPFQLSGWTLYLLVALLGIILTPIPLATFSAVPEVMRNPQQVGIGLAVIAMGMNLGFVVGPILFGALVENMGWTQAGYCLIPISLTGFIAGWFTRVR